MPVQAADPLQPEESSFQPTVSCHLYEVRPDIRPVDIVVSVAPPDLSRRWNSCDAASWIAAP